MPAYQSMRRTMTERLRRKNDFIGSMFRNPCPTCGAKPFQWCLTRNGRISGICHGSRQKPTGDPRLKERNGTV